MNNYFYIDIDGVQHGPVPVDQLIKQQSLLPKTLVWNNTLVEWQRADSVEELKECFATTNNETTPPPIPSLQNETTNNNGAQCNRTIYHTNLQKPYNWLVWNILSVVLCCGIIPGIIGIIYSAKVDNLWFAGRYEEAVSAASVAKIMFFVSLGLCFLWPLGSLLAPLLFTDFISMKSCTNQFFPY